MFHIAKTTWPVLIAGVLLVSACSGPKATSSPTPDAAAQLTSVASTVQAELTQVAALTPKATATLAPTEPQTAPTALAPTLPLASEAPAAAPTVALPAVADKGLYVSQTITDGTKMDPGKKFTMSWKFTNTGTTTWTTKYQIRFFAGNALGAETSAAFPQEVKPGDEVDISVKMKAPSTKGSYRSVWVLTNADGANFQSCSLDIAVGDAPTATNTSAPAATNTSAPAPTNTPAPPAATAAPTTATTP